MSRRWTLGLLAGALSVPVVFAPAAAHADATAYLIGVHVRPGYNFPNADAARQWVERGAQFVLVVVDALLGPACRNYLATVRGV